MTAQAATAWYEPMVPTVRAVAFGDQRARNRIPSWLSRRSQAAEFTIRVTTHDAVQALYDKLVKQPPPDSTAAKRRGGSSTSAVARSWQPPLARGDLLTDDSGARSAARPWTDPSTSDSTAADASFPGTA